MKNETSEKMYSGAELRTLFQDFLRVAVRLWWVAAALAVVLSAALCLRARLHYHPRYQASATFTVYVANPLQSEIRGYNAATAEQMAKTFPYILTSGALRDMVMRDLGIKAMPTVQASVLEDTNIFTLTVTAEEPQKAYEVLNAVIEHYPEVAEFVVGPTVMNLLDESGVPAAPCNSISLMGQIRRGTVIGLALWAFLCLLLTVARSTVHNEEELKQVLNIRCIGALPVVRRARREHGEVCPMLEYETAGHGFPEAVRLLRMRVEKEMHQREAKILLVSSATPGEGKTTVAINLAKSLAMKGKRALIVDCDLRNPSVARNMGMENKNGLVDFMEGRLSAEKTLKKTELDSLFITAAGGPVENAAELLSGRRSQTFMKACRSIFDYIILDTPPSSLLADASEIAAAADAALLVIRQNYASKVQIIEGARQLADSGLEIVGCAMNYTDGNALSGHSGYYGYGGYYGHYGSYGHYGRDRERGSEEI